jgi:hypothetical protein
MVARNSQKMIARNQGRTAIFVLLLCGAERVQNDRKNVDLAGGGDSRVRGRVKKCEQIIGRKNIVTTLLCLTSLVRLVDDRHPGLQDVI